jgi:hypothetical protein
MFQTKQNLHRLLKMEISTTDIQVTPNFKSMGNKLFCINRTPNGIIIATKYLEKLPLGCQDWAQNWVFLVKIEFIQNWYSLRPKM